jgi:hypothetical protein
LDEETVLNKLPFVTVDEVSQIIARKDAEMAQRVDIMDSANNGGGNEPTEGEEE